MVIQVWRFVTLVLTALLTGMTFCHALEMPAKLKYSAALYLTLHRTLYVAFGPPSIGVFVELGAILGSIGLVFLLRRRLPGFWPTLLGAACLVTGLVVYFALVEPANAALKAMAIGAPPEDWMTWRNQWEYGHTTHFALDFIGLCALVASALTSKASLPARRLESRSPRLHEPSLQR